MNCQNEIEENKNSIFQNGSYTEKKFKLDLIRSINIEEELQISSFFVTEDMSVFLYDLLSGQIKKINAEGKIVASTGGFGQGPNEYFQNSIVQITYCDGNEFYSNDWNLPRFQVYDLQLKLKKIINLEGIPYDITCTDKNQIAVLYSNIPQIDILEINSGSIHKSIRIDRFLDHDTTKESIFKHFIYTEEKYFFGYYFKPYFYSYDTNKQTVEKTLLTMNPLESVTTASRALLDNEDEVHLFYFNINQSESAEYKKITHVFKKTTGKYIYSYPVPEHIKNYLFISHNKLIAIEDSTVLGLYNYSIDEE